MSHYSKRRRSRYTGVLVLMMAIAAGALWYYAPGALPDEVRKHLPVAESSPAHFPALYKWKDDDGRWNVTDRPPEGRPFEEVRVDQDTNVLPPNTPPSPDN